MVVRSKADRIWRAFITVAWYASGEEVFRQIKNKTLAHDLYAWYLGVDDEF